MSTSALIDAIRHGLQAHESLDLARQRIHEETRFRDPVELRHARLRFTRTLERAQAADALVAQELAAWIAGHKGSRCVCSVTPGHVPCSEHDR